jgi:5-formyltetrahydrofolate cyclo-ligase
VATAQLDKHAWRRRLRAARRAAQAGGPNSRALLETAGYGGQLEAVPPGGPGWPDLAGSPGLAALLPNPGESVAAFHSTASEPPTTDLLALLAARGLTVLVPDPGPDLRQLAWTAITPATCALPVRPNVPVTSPHAAAGPIRTAGGGGIGLGETPYARATTLGPEALAGCQLVLAPALAVDLSGTRLGQGGGWYDQALRFAAPGALVLAVCFPAEVLPPGTLPREAHDVAVHGALTSCGVQLI